MLLNLSACGLFTSREDDMLDYMEKKYGESFTTVEPFGGQLGSKYTMILVKGTYAEDALVRVVYEEAPLVYQDNYLGFIHKQEIETLLEPLAEQAFGTCKLFYKVPRMVFPVETTKHTTAEELLGNPYTMTRIYVYPKDNSEDNSSKIDMLQQQLAEKGYCIGVIISFPPDEKWYDFITEDTFVGAVYQGYEADEEIVFQMDREGGYRSLYWLIKDGKSVNE